MSACWLYRFVDVPLENSGARSNADTLANGEDARTLHHPARTADVLPLDGAIVLNLPFDGATALLGITWLCVDASHVVYGDVPSQSYQCLKDLLTFVHVRVSGPSSASPLSPLVCTLVYSQTRRLFGQQVTH